MRKSGSSRFFARRADMSSQRNRHDRIAPVDVKNNGQAIGQFELFKFDL